MPEQRPERPPADDTQAAFLARSLGYMQESLRKSGPAVVAGYTLIGAIGFGGIGGYALDAWLGTAPWLLLSGLLFGVVVGFYELAKIVWRP
jgi:F0F1-type ATP synthase assembly protein I